MRVSIGFAVAAAGKATDYETIKHTAAAALTEAKNTGRNKCVFHPVLKLPFEQAG